MAKRIGGIRGLALVAVTIPAAFWLAYGRIDGYAIGLTAFLVMVGAAIELVPRAAPAPDVAKRSSRWDVLGVVWLLAIPFAPFVAWILRTAIDVDLGNWKTILGITAGLCVVVPSVCVLPLLRYVRRGTAGVALTILAVGTAFPVVTGLGAAYDVTHGPAWQDVTIDGIDDVDFRTGTGTRVNAKHALVRLADGRILSRSQNVVLRRGPARLLVLRGIGRVLDVQR